MDVELGQHNEKIPLIWPRAHTTSLDDEDRPLAVERAAFETLFFSYCFRDEDVMIRKFNDIIKLDAHGETEIAYPQTEMRSMFN